MQAETLSASPESKPVAIILWKREKKNVTKLSSEIASTGRQPATKLHPFTYPDVRGLLKSHLSSRRARLTDGDCGIAI